jgi:hypothetical protein
MLVLMARKKVTYLVDEELATALKARAVREGKPDYRVLDDALRAHLGYGVWEQLWAKATLSEEDADALVREAVEEVRAELHEERRTAARRRT